MDAADKWLTQRLGTTPTQSGKRKNRKTKNQQSLKPVDTPRQRSKSKVNVATKKILENYARQMQLHATPAETHFLLQIACRLEKEHNIKFDSQKVIFVNHDKGYILDFFFPKWRVAVEVDGRPHFTTAGRQNDEARTKALNDIGIKVFRYSNSTVLDDTEYVFNDLLHRFHILPIHKQEKTRLYFRRVRAWAEMRTELDDTMDYAIAHDK